MSLEKRSAPSERGQDAKHLQWLNPLVLDLAIEKARGREIQVKDLIEEVLANSLAVDILSDVLPDALAILQHSSISPWDLMETMFTDREMIAAIAARHQDRTPVITEVNRNITGQ